MKRIITYLVGALLCFSANAQHFVYEINGNAYVKSSTWKAAYRSMQVNLTDSIRTDGYSAVVILDRNSNRLYSLQATRSELVQDLLNEQKKTSRSLIKEVCQGLFATLFTNNNKSMEAYNRSSGVTYRDEDSDLIVAQALAASKSSSSEVTFRIIDRHTGHTLTETQVGELAVAEITNNTGVGLYINIADFDSAGNMAPIFPADENSTMLHLYMPARSVVRLYNYPVEFFEPRGTDTLVLVAYHKPFNLMNVLNMLKDVQAHPSQEVHTWSSPITIGK